MRYADTCLLLSLIYRDPGSEAALAWLEQVGTGEILISHWALTEFVSAAGIMARRGDIDARLHREGLAHCRRFVAARLQVETPIAADFERAAVWLEECASGLRAGDALHLSIAARVGAVLCSADKTLLAAAANLGLAVEAVPPQP
jgi:predicted nucleic acid-binding protein